MSTPNKEKKKNYNIALMKKNKLKKHLKFKY